MPIGFFEENRSKRCSEAHAASQKALQIRENFGLAGACRKHPQRPLAFRWLLPLPITCAYVNRRVARGPAPSRALPGGLCTVCCALHTAYFALRNSSIWRSEEFVECP
jgi:hypothetical protein